MKRPLLPGGRAGTPPPPPAPGRDPGEGKGRGCWQPEGLHPEGQHGIPKHRGRAALPERLLQRVWGSQEPAFLTSSMVLMLRLEEPALRVLKLGAGLLRALVTPRLHRLCVKQTLSVHYLFQGSFLMSSGRRWRRVPRGPQERLAVPQDHDSEAPLCAWLCSSVTHRRDEGCVPKSSLSVLV